MTGRLVSMRVPPMSASGAVDHIYINIVGSVDEL